MLVLKSISLPQLINFGLVLRIGLGTKCQVSGLIFLNVGSLLKRLKRENRFISFFFLEIC